MTKVDKVWIHTISTMDSMSHMVDTLEENSHMRANVNFKKVH